jgi:hypothetical protein
MSLSERVEENLLEFPKLHYISCSKENFDKDVNESNYLLLNPNFKGLIESLQIK